MNLVVRVASIWNMPVLVEFFVGILRSICLGSFDHGFLLLLLSGGGHILGHVCIRIASHSAS